MDQGRLKFRIIGAAVVLGVLAVLVLMVMGREPPAGTGPQDIALPAEPTQGLAGEIRADDARPPPQLPELEDIPLPAPPAPADLQPPEPPAATVSPVPAPTAPPAAPKPAPVAPPPQAAVPAPAPAPTAERLGVQAFIVQVGSYTNRASAQQVHDKLKAAGYKVFTEETRAAGQTSVRVRVGPELSRVSAEQIRDRIAREQGLTGVVLRFQ